MNKKKILQAAQRYIADEHEALFASEVQRLIQEDNLAELEDRFYQPLSFGTGGLRGKIGGGLNRMNPLVVGRCTKGIGVYLQRCFKGEDVSVAICFDARHHSRYFSRMAACILAELGIRVFLFSDARPTPLLSFTVHDRACHTGIMVTASHNPPEYNGYKVYWGDGAQVVEPHDAEIEKLSGTLNGPLFDKDMIHNNLDYIYNRVEDFCRKGLIVYTDASLEQRFLQAVLAERRNPSLSLQNISIAYTPLHGVGGSLIKPVADALQVALLCEPSQSLPDGGFPTVSSPNPEDPASLERVIALCKTNNCDAFIATDPDADRIGIGIETKHGTQCIDGNQLGALVIDYLLANSKQLDEPFVVVNTIVTSDLQQKIIALYGALQKQTATGFKNIAGVLRALAKEDKLSQFLMGTEESFGLLIGTHVWDKDSITAALIVWEMIAYYKAKGLTVYDRLMELYAAHDFYKEKTYSFTFEGSEGMQKIAGIMAAMRKVQQTSFAGRKVSKRIDFLHQRVEVPNEANEPNNMPQTFSDTPHSNVLKWYLEGFGWICLRPSGTEPKIKLYYSYTEVFSNLEQGHKNADDAIQAVHAEFLRVFE